MFIWQKFENVSKYMWHIFVENASNKITFFQHSKFNIGNYCTKREDLIIIYNIYLNSYKKLLSSCATHGFPNDAFIS